MIFEFTRRMLAEVDGRALVKFAYNFGWKGALAVRRFEKRVRRGGGFPAFLILSLTDRCNLRCQGCWVGGSGQARDLPWDLVEKVIRAARSQGSFFFGLLGGEPMLYPELLRIIARHRDCYFQVFTNGTLITGETAAAMRRLGNVTLLLSVEGLEGTSDERRGGVDVYARTMAGLEACRKNRLVTGVASSVCRSNFPEVVSERFVRDMARRGAHYLWYYIYRPVGPNPSPELALSEEQIRALRRFIVDIRPHAPLLIIDAYWDHEGRAVCPAAMGISHHVGPAGDLEFCPPLQFSRDSLAGSADLVRTVGDSCFLRNLREFAARDFRGCVILRRPGELREFLEREDAHDTTHRGSGWEELARMRPCACHDLPGREIPETHWAYRLAKKYWFFGFGAYG